jgi:cell division protein FtsW
MSKNTAVAKKKPDTILLYTSIALIVLGILTLASVSASLSYKTFDSTFYFLQHQIIFGLIPGIILGIFVFKKDIEWIKKKSSIIFLLNLFLLFLVIAPKLVGLSSGVMRSLDLFFFSIQPAEFLKLTVILYLASWWSSFKNKKIEGSENKNLSLIVFLTIMAVIGFLIVLQPNVSTFGIIAIIAAIVYFSANSALWHTPFLGALGVAAFLTLMKTADYRSNRLAVFLDPETDPMGIGYQLKQAMITIGSGGLAGVGIGLSQQKGYLPELLSDSIFAIFAEETGFIGSFILIALFVLFAWRGFLVAYHSNDIFCRLTAVGISSWIMLETFINISTMIGIIPLTGVPLPFMSYGGSALISELIGVGLLLNISRQS